MWLEDLIMAIGKLIIEQDWSLHEAIYESCRKRSKDIKNRVKSLQHFLIEIAVRRDIAMAEMEHLLVFCFEDCI